MNQRQSFGSGGRSHRFGRRACGSVGGPRGGRARWAAGRGRARRRSHPPTLPADLRRAGRAGASLSPLDRNGTRADRRHPTLPHPVDLHDAVAVLGRFPALAGVTIRSRHGEIVLLRGPNGAGKTTLLRLCAGPAPLALGVGRGRCDLRTQRGRPSARGSGCSATRTGCTTTSPSRENVRFWGAAAARRSRDRGGAHAAGARRPTGRRRRWAGCRRVRSGGPRWPAWWPDGPQLWLLDEPHAGLDAAGRDELDAPCARRSPAGATVMVASHELERAGALATRVVDVVGGQAGAPRSDDASDGAPRPGGLRRTARLSSRKDLRVERRSRVVDQPGVAVRRAGDGAVRLRARRRRGRCERAAPGLVWLARSSACWSLVQRSFAIETADGALDALRVAGVSTPGIFLGKSFALAVAAARARGAAGGAGDRALRVRARPAGAVLLVTTLLPATTGLAFVGTLYGGLAAGAGAARHCSRCCCSRWWRRS